MKTLIRKMIYVPAYLVCMLSLINTDIRSSLVISDTTKKELEAEKISTILGSGTFTNQGFLQLKELIEHPLSNVEAILDRQNIIKKLVKSPDLIQKIGPKIKKIASLDSDAILASDNSEVLKSQGLDEFKIPYWAKIDFEDEEALLPSNVELVYWKPKKQASIYYDAAFLLKQGTDFSSFLNILGLQGLAFKIMHEGTKKAEDPNYKSAYHDGPFKETCKWIGKNYVQSIKENFNWLNVKNNSEFIDPNNITPADFFKIAYLHPTAKDVFSYYSKTTEQGTEKILPAILAPVAKPIGSIVGLPATSLHILYANIAPLLSFLTGSGITMVVKRFYLLFHLRKQMVKLRELLFEFKNLATLIENEFPEMQETCKDLIAWSKDCSVKCKDLFDTLCSSTFAQSKYIFRPGNVIKAAHILNDVRDEITKVYSAIGYIDAYVALASTYNVTQETPVQFCFANFVETQEASLDIQGLWLPTILSNKNSSLFNITTNNVHLSRDTHQKIIISGPNGTGKSVVLKGIGVATLLAQSIGLAPAKEYTISIMHSIQTSISPDEDTSIGMSRFGSELLILEEIKKAVEENNAQNLKTLLLVDEPCRGTHPEETAVRFSAFAHALAESENILFVCASHSSEIPNLEKTTNKKFVNYHMLVHEVSPGIFQQSYLLANGPADWWFNDAAKRSRYVSWFLEYVVKPKINSKQ